MSRYQKIFTANKRKNKIAFIPFWMIGDPTISKSLAIIRELAKSADILELGIPFSDPLADGPVIQEAVNRALKNKTNTTQCLRIIKTIRSEFPSLPIGLLVYFNLIISFGVEKFFATCQKSGVDSILIPELPIEEIDLSINGEGSIQSIAKKYKIDLIFLVSTNTPENRRKRIFQTASGFIYGVSSPTTTGAKINLKKDTVKMLQTIKKETDTPVCIGFGVSSPKDIQILKKAGADGAIIGSKIIKLYQEKLKSTNHASALQAVSTFCRDCQQITS